jgi:hypothetical protein
VTPPRHEIASPTPAETFDPIAQDAGVANLKKLTQLIANLKETITQQSNVIESVRIELVEIKDKQRALKNQNSKLQEEAYCVFDNKVDYCGTKEGATLGKLSESADYIHNTRAFSVCPVVITPDQS